MAPGVQDGLTTGVAVGGIFGAAKEMMYAKGAHHGVTSMTSIGKGVLGPAVHCAIAGGLFGFGTSAMAGLRNKEDSLNGAAGGAMAGVYFGLKGKGGLHMAVYKAVGFGAIGILCNYMGTYVNEQAAKNKAADAAYR